MGTEILSARAVGRNALARWSFFFLTFFTAASSQLCVVSRHVWFLHAAFSASYLAISAAICSSTVPAGGAGAAAWREGRLGRGVRGGEGGEGGAGPSSRERLARGPAEASARKRAVSLQGRKESSRARACGSATPRSRRRVCGADSDAGVRLRARESMGAESSKFER